MNLTGQCIYLVKSILKMDLIDKPITILKKKNEKHMKPDIFVELLSVNS